MKQIMNTASLVAISLLISSCTRDPDGNLVLGTLVTKVPRTVVTSPIHVPAEVKLGEFTGQMICRAAISAMMATPVEIIKAESFDSLIHLHYFRLSDNRRWDYQCKQEHNRIIWRSIWDGAPSRWRTHPTEEMLTFLIDPVADKLTIYEDYTNGSKLIHEYQLNELK